MTRIAVIADIHGNMPALEAVLDDLAGQAVDEVLVGGDLVGRGPEGNAVADRIRSLGLESICGNHEEYVLGTRRGELPDTGHDTDVWDAARFMADELSSTNARFLESLPFSIAREGLLLVHGTPTSNRDGIGPWTSDEKIADHLDDATDLIHSAHRGAGAHPSRARAPLLVCAHTHRPLDRTVARGRVVNIGSVGLPFNRDQRAQYAVFERRARGGWRVEAKTVAYDVERILAIYASSGFLARGGVTARLLRLEIEHACPLLVPFLAWAERTGTAPDSAHLDRFLAFHRPGEPLRDFYRRLTDTIGDDGARGRGT